LLQPGFGLWPPQGPRHIFRGRATRAKKREIDIANLKPAGMIGFGRIRDLDQFTRRSLGIAQSMWFDEFHAAPVAGEPVLSATEQLDR
jgi:hypothetical protein